MKRVLAGIICLSLLVSMQAGEVVHAKEYCVVANVANDEKVLKNNSPAVDTFPGQPMDDLDMEEVRLLAAVIWAEAEGEDQHGKRLVASTVLNRVDDPRFPNSTYEVIYQPGQFSTVNNGRMATGLALQEPSCVSAAMEELLGRTDTRVLYFCCSGWGYGTPYMQYGNHYFSY